MPKQPARRTPAVDSPTAKDIVGQFIARSNRLDIDGAMQLIAAGCVYQNVPFHRAVGIEAIGRDFRRMMRTLDHFHIANVHIVAEGDVVMTERVDALANRLFRIDLPVMGVFVVRDGKIVEWRDYFDWSNLVARMAGAAATWPLRALRPNTAK